MWERLNTTADLDAMNAASFQQPILLFKHSTTCMTSRMALDRMERDPSGARDRRWFLIDVHRDRPISNAIADRYDVQHESPQVLVIDQGTCRYTASHIAIRAAEVQEALTGGPA
jgi:bacillithiol system protein YtxJ